MSNIYDSKTFQKILLKKLNINSFNNLNKAKFADAIKMEHNTIQKLVSGATKNPGIKTIMAVAKGLNCSIDELVGNNIFTANNNSLLSNELSFDNTVFKKIFVAVSVYIEEKKLDPPMKKVFYAIDTIYDYSLRRNHNELDNSYVTWVLENTFSKKNKSW